MVVYNKKIRVNFKNEMNDLRDDLSKITYLDPSFIEFFSMSLFLMIEF